MGQVGDDEGVWRPLGQHARHEQAEGEAEGHGQRGASGGDVVACVTVGWARQFAHPRRRRPEGRPAAHPGEEVANKEQPQAVAAGGEGDARQQ